MDFEGPLAIAVLAISDNRFLFPRLLDGVVVRWVLEDDEFPKRAFLATGGSTI
jgi:hypothetical protein